MQRYFDRFSQVFYLPQKRVFFFFTPSWHGRRHGGHLGVEIAWPLSREHKNILMHSCCGWSPFFSVVSSSCGWSPFSVLFPPVDLLVLLLSHSCLSHAQSFTVLLQMIGHFGCWNLPAFADIFRVKFWNRLFAPFLVCAIFDERCFFQRLWRLGSLYSAFGYSTFDCWQVDITFCVPDATLCSLVFLCIRVSRVCLSVCVRVCTCGGRGVCTVCACVSVRVCACMCLGACKGEKERPRAGESEGERESVCVCEANW